MLFFIYLIAPLGNLRHSIAVLLTALGADQQIEQFDTFSAALRHEPDKAPDLIVCDVVILDETVLDELARLRSRWPDARLVIMRENEESVARLIGDAVVINTGAAAARLRTMLSDLLRDVRDSA